MRLGLTIVGDSLDNFIRYVQQADQAGVAVIGTGDSQTLYGELWVRCTLAGMLPRALVGPWATNPVTRHPSVTAGAAATLAELTAGKMVCGGNCTPAQAAAPGSPLSTRPCWRCATTAASVVIKSLRATRHGGNRQWAGSLASDSICWPTTRGSCWRFGDVLI